MRTKLLFVFTALCFFVILYLGFSPNDQGPKWNPGPSTRININPPSVDQLHPLPTVDNSIPINNEPAYYYTPQGVYVVNAQFRVHPITNINEMQTEVPITRHPSNPLIMFGSANTTRNGGQFSTGWFVTTDGGTSWFGNDTLLNGGGTGVFNFGDPGPMIDKNGRFLISYITLAGQMGASYSTNNGVNWSSTVTFPGSTTSSDKNLSATDDAPSSAFYGRSYTAYTEFGGAFVNRIVLTYTTDGGVSWSTVAPVSPVPVAGSNYFHQGADVKCGPNGEVYVVWTCANSTISPYTEDSLGFAKSTNGGVSWTIATNHAANVNGDRDFSFINGIRIAGFPRIDVDRTCGPRAGWIYVTVGEKNPGVAGDIGDIVLYKSTNGGTTWSTGVRVNQDAFGNGKKQYMAALRVDESGGVNVVYYDTRNTPTNDSSEVYLSRSTDGGVTFTDLKVGNKFKHAPTGFSNVNSIYAGDYIGITSALIEGNPANGNQRIWPYWMNNITGNYNAYTAKVELLPKNPCPGCQDFSSTLFTPSYFSLEFTGTQYWGRFTPSAYGVGAGAARFNSWNAGPGVVQSLVTDFEAVGAGNFLTFDEGYGAWSSGGAIVDSLIVESSTNAGTSYTNLARLWGSLSGGPLNTAPAGPLEFTPLNSQWAPKIYALPVNTNKIRLRGVSGNGNDIWIDNVCIQSLPATSTPGFGIAEEGYYIPTPPSLRAADTVRIYLHRLDFPNVVVDSSKTILATTGTAIATFPLALSGTYYIRVNHRNCIETFSKVGGLAFTRGVTGTLYNLIRPMGQAFDNNQKLIDVGLDDWGMFSGDINQDHFIDLVDITAIYNAASLFTTGYKVTDVTGDNITDLSDLIICYNNSANFVTRHAPPGAEPEPAPVITQDDSRLIFENDAQRQKYEMSKVPTEEMLKMNQELIKKQEKTKLYEEKNARRMMLLEKENLSTPVRKDRNSNSIF